MSVSKEFNDKFETITNNIAFDPAWKNGTGYFDHAVEKDLGLRDGDLGRSTDEHGRRIILIGTMFGNVVLFERFAPDQDEDGERSSFIVRNLPNHVRKLEGGAFPHQMDSNLMFYYLGDNNIGTRLKNLMKSFMFDK